MIIYLLIVNKLKYLRNCFSYLSEEIWYFCSPKVFGMLYFGADNIKHNSGAGGEVL